MDIRKDLHSWIKSILTAPVASMTTSQVGAIVDTQGFNVIELFFLSSAITSGVFTPVIEVSMNSDMSNAITLNNNNLIGILADVVFTAADDNAVKSVGVVLSTYRYLRVTINGTSTPVGVLGQMVVLSNPNTMYAGSPQVND